jgi:hypothetical protein
MGIRGGYLYVVTDRGVVEQRSVKFGPEVPGGRLVREGLAMGDWVIVNARFHLEPGKQVRPRKTNLSDAAPADPTRPDPNEP